MRSPTILKILAIALLIQAAFSDDCFKDEGDNVKFSGSCTSGKATLFSKSDSFEVLFDAEKVKMDSDAVFKIGGCEIMVNLALNTYGKAFMIGDSYDLPITATVSKSAVKFVDKKNNQYDPKCTPAFKPVDDGGFTIEIDFSLTTAVPVFNATFKNVNLYKPLSPSKKGESSESQVLIAVIITLVILFLLVVASVAGMIVYFRRKSKKAKEQKPDGDQKLVEVERPAEVKKQAKKESKVQTVDETKKSEKKSMSKASVASINPVAIPILPVKTARDYEELHTAKPSIVPEAPVKVYVQPKVRTTKATAETRTTDDGPNQFIYLGVDERYLMWEETVAHLLTIIEAHRQFSIFTGGLKFSAEIIASCNRILKDIDETHEKDKALLGLQSDVRDVKSLAREVAEFLSGGIKTNCLPYSFKSIWQLGQASELVLLHVSKYSPLPEVSQFGKLQSEFNKLELKQDVSSDPETGKIVKKLRLFIQELSKRMEGQESLKTAKSS